MGMPPDSRDYYEILHVSRDAPLEIIRASYRMLMQRLRHHPDLGGDPATAALINEAYAVLTDTERRSEYDARLAILAQVAEGLVEEELPPQPEPIRSLDPFRECVFCEVPHEHGKFIEVDAGCNNCGSPLYTADYRRMEQADQRAVARIDKRQYITFYTEWPQRRGHRGVTEDISLNGLRLVTKAELREGQRIKIVSEVVEAIAQVTNCIYERHGWTTVCIAGVSFTTLRFVRSVGGFLSRRV